MSINHNLSHIVVTWCTGVVLRLWNETIGAHRAAVREAILDITAALMAEHGLSGMHLLHSMKIPTLLKRESEL